MDIDTFANQIPEQDDEIKEFERVMDLHYRPPTLPQENSTFPESEPETESEDNEEDNDEDGDTTENDIPNLKATSETPPPKKRLPRGMQPPTLNLEEAVQVIKSFYEDAGGEANYDALSKILNNSSASSTFQRKVAALRNYNLIVDENRNLKLSDTGYDIVAPRDPAQRNRALKQAFLSIDIFDKIYLKFMGRLLPQEEFLVNSFKDYVPKDVAQDWMEGFKTSARYADLFLEREDGKLQVREGIGGESKVETKTNSTQEQPKQETEAKETQEKPIEEKPPYMPPPTPKSYYEFLIEILSPDMQQEEQDAVWTLIRYLKEQEAKKRVNNT